ncbi:multiple coagulation factor deficiency protein 2 homolog [Hyposmocoma kahamanoa]|uniref:multiple coagulation factor deficiency protein 2 homolog n=1 Tax=Hyposmocoma kahamanoa TaxID=1477025 RepID=UPI000E6D9899|nr:multiple coagulation factor deficiency protein 2 homolog [Hyposmocoma kahamanoa]XP_026330777.1 multiple coagulation factor deficiency protein 2 homolog [Hyposmocoma kahamanoa]
MKAEVYLLLVLHTLTLALRRGPHHPSGQPVEQHHHHYKPRGSESLTGDIQLLHDTKHIEEDSQVLTREMVSRMSPEELEFHYFSSHDFDRNSKLDGLEMLKAVYHTMEHEGPDPDSDVSIEPEASSNDLEKFIAIVDRTLDSDDADDDGFVSYVEYRAARINYPLERTPRVVAAVSP